MDDTKCESSDEEWVERPGDDSGGQEDRHEVSSSSKSVKVVGSPEKKESSDKKEKNKVKGERSAETSTSKFSEERKDRNDDKHHGSSRYGRREDKMRRDNDYADESCRSKKYNDDEDRISNKRPRRDDVDSERMDHGNRHGSRDKRRDGYHNRGRDERERFQRKDDRRDYGTFRRSNQSGGSSYHSRGRGRNEDRDRCWRGKEKKNEREDRSTWDIRPSADEVAKQKKLLWGKSGKSLAQANEEASSGCGDHGSGESATSPTNPQKNVGLWSSAISACGVDGDQANKFLKLMGIKNAPVVNPASEDNKRIQEESEKQRKMMRDLDRQYEIAREATHMGRGLGLGFHQ